MSEETEEKPDIVALIKEYISTRIELGKLTVVDRLTSVVANIITDTVVVFAGLLTFLFASLTLGFYFGELFESNAKGFGLVALIYLLIGVIVYFTKDKYIEKYLINFMVRKIYKKKK